MVACRICGVDPDLLDPALGLSLSICPSCGIAHCLCYRPQTTSPLKMNPNGETCVDWQ